MTIHPAGTVPASSWPFWPAPESLTPSTATFRIQVEMGAGFVDQDAEYLDKDQYQYVYAVELELRAREAGGDDADLFVSSIPFITGSAEAPANTPFDGGLIQPLSFRRSIINSSFSGLISASGEIEIDNSAGDFDDALSGKTSEDTAVTVRLGRLGDPLDDFVTVHVGIAEVEEITRTKLIIPITDNSRLLSVPLVEDVYPGGGGMGGSEDLAGKKIPFGVGYPGNIQPPLLDRSIQLYQVSNGPVQGVPAVYANGSRLYQETDFATSEELIEADITQGKYSTCNAEGVMRVEYNLDGQVITCDLEGDDEDGFAGTVGQIIRKLATRAGVTEFDEAAFERFESVHGYRAQGWFDINDTSTIADAMRRIGGFGVYFGFRRDGSFTIGRLEAPNDFPSLYVDTIDILDDSGGIEKVPLPEGYNPSPWRFRVAFGENYTIQTGTNVAGIVSDERKAYLAERHRFAVASNADIKSASPRPRDREPVDSSLVDGVDAGAWADHLLDFFRETRSLWRIPLHREGRVTDIGRILHVTAPSMPELASGLPILIVDVDEDATTGRCSNIGIA